jgi:hypothetical protein
MLEIKRYRREDKYPTFTIEKSENSEVTSLQNQLGHGSKKKPMGSSKNGDKISWNPILKMREQN